MLKKEILEQDKETMDLEYNLICDFIKLRHELGLTQQQMELLKNNKSFNNLEYIEYKVNDKQALPL